MSEADECPGTMYDNLAYEDRKKLITEIHDDWNADGEWVRFCPLPKIPSQIECPAVDEKVVWDVAFGWVYCIGDTGCAYRIRLTVPLQEAVEGRRLTIRCDTVY